MRTKQRTIRKPVELTGVGMFSGAPVKLRLCPAAADAGVTFVRTDLPARTRIPVHIDNLAARPRRTAVARDGAEVETIEHLMSAIHGLEIDDLDVEIDAAEVPGVDGSSAPFAELLRRAEFVDLEAPRRIFAPKEPISVVDDDSSLVALPGKNGLSISFTLDYQLSYFGPQHYTLEVGADRYTKEIAPSRTFCLQSEVQALLAQGMGKGASYQNTLVIGPEGVIQNEVRFKDEFVRHKILDLIGDLALLGCPLQAHVVALRAGHASNARLVKALHKALGAQNSGRRQETFLDVREILKILPHRYPFLLIDKVIELDSYKKAVGIKNVTYNEPFFQGHFPGQPIMPGVLQIEAMAQLAGALLLRKAENANKLAVLLSIDKVKLRKTVVPGDQLRIEAEAERVKNRTGFVHTWCTVDGKLVCEAWMKFMVVDPE